MASMQLEKTNTTDTYELYTGSLREVFSILDNNRSESGNHIHWAWNNRNKSIKLEKANINHEHFSETWNIYSLKDLLDPLQ